MAFAYDPESGIPEDQDFVVNGTGAHRVVSQPEGPRLEVDAIAAPRYFVKRSTAAASGEIHLEARLAGHWENASDTDSGIGFAIDEGPEGQRIWVSCRMDSGSPHLELAGATAIPLDWTGAEVTIKFGRHADGSAYLDVPGVDPVTADRRSLPSSEEPEPSFVFGCLFDLQSVRAWFGRIGPPEASTADLEITNIELQPNAAERVKVEGTLSTDLDPATVGIEKVGLRCALAGSRFYPTTDDDFMPVAVRRDGDKWVITQDARDDTGIQSLELVHVGGGRFEFHLNDARTNLAEQDYGQVEVEILLHRDDGGEDVTAKKAVALQKSGQTYRGPA